MVVPALLVTAFILTACSTEVGGKSDFMYDEYEPFPVTLTDGRTIECVFFGAHKGYDCNWDTNNEE